MSLPKIFWLRVTSSQKTWLASKGDRGFCLVREVTAPDQVIGKVRVKPQPSSKIRRNQQGSYHLPVLVGKSSTPGEVFWTPPVEGIIYSALVQLVSIRSGYGPDQQRVLELTFKYDYESGNGVIVALDRVVATRLLTQLKQTLFPEEEVD